MKPLEEVPKQIHYSSQKLRKQFKSSGYLLLRSFFSESEISNIEQKVVEQLVQAGWGRVENEKVAPLAPVNRIGSASFYKCIQKLMAIENIHLLAHDSNLLNLLNNLLGDNIYPHPRKMVRINYPYSLNPKDSTPPHQDFFYVKGEVDTFTVWVPLGNYGVEQGGLTVAEGSHKYGLLPTEANSEGRFGCSVVSEDTKGYDWRFTEYRRGDVLIMHSLTVHAALLNKGRFFRLSLDCRFSAQNGYINEEQLLPPYYPHIEPWDCLSSSWVNKGLVDPVDTLEKISPEVSALQQLSKCLTIMDSSD